MNGINRIRIAALFGAGAVAFAMTAVGAQSTSIPRTPWGDPDIQGTYTNSNESGIPMERPAELAGRRLEDVKPEELAKLIQQRAARAEQTAEVIGGTQDENTGAGPKHWYENYQATNSRAWMISDRSGLQDAGDHRRRQAAGGGRARGAARRRRLLHRPVRQSRGPDALRAVHHARRARVR